MLYKDNKPYFLIRKKSLDIDSKLHLLPNSTIYSSLVGFLKSYYQRFVFTNGQVYQFSTLLFTKVKSYFFIGTDFFSNKLWVLLDQPKIFRHLIQFFHRYVGAVPEGVITSEMYTKRR